MNPTNWKKFSPLLIGAVLLFGQSMVRAEDGWYLSTDLGVAWGPELDVLTGGLDDWASAESAAHSSIRCDKTINPDGFQTLPGACGSDPAVWGPMNETFDGGGGILSGLALGYRKGKFRIEGEYFYRHTAHDATAVPTTPDWDPSTDKGYHAVRDAVDDVIDQQFLCQSLLRFPLRIEAHPLPGYRSRPRGYSAGVPDVVAPHK